MSEEIKKDNKVDESELLARLKQKADLLGIRYNSQIGLNKLKEKVDLFLKEQEDKSPINETSAGPNKSIVELERQARKPVYAKINDLDASQKGDPTIVINIGNKYFKVGCIVEKSKPQLIPSAIVKALEAKTMIEWVDQISPNTKRPTGNKIARTTKRYNIDIINANPKIEDFK